MKRDDMLIEADELLEKIGDSNLRIYDATILHFRKESDPTAHEQYLQAHIPGAAFFNHDDFSDASSAYMYMVLPKETLATQIGNIGIASDSEVIFYTSAMLPYATRAWWLLHYAGHDNVRVLNGGLAAWQEAGGEIKQGGHKYPAAEFEGNLRPNMFASKEEVQAVMDDDAVCTVNTLSPEMYEQGHISDSSLLSCNDLMQGMTAFLPDEYLATRLKEEAQHKRIITYCGAGITATVNAMAHLMVGNNNVSVYDGSMSEWAGEGLPITTGSASS